MDRLDAIKILVRVVESGSCAAVARKMGVGQPTISRQIAMLEAHLAAQLIIRTPVRLIPEIAAQPEPGLRFRRKSGKRFAFGSFDRLVFIGLHRLVPGIVDALAQASWGKPKPE